MPSPGERSVRGESTPPAARLRIAGAAAWVFLAGCGGGGEDGPAPAAPDRALPTAIAVDGNATEAAVDLRVAQAGNGDAFVVWRARDGTRHNLWASRYRAAEGTWGSPARMETSDDDIGADFDVWVDAEGNAAALWRHPSTGFVSARFDIAVGGWTAAAPLVFTAFQGTGTEVAFNIAPDGSGRQPGGFYFDPVRGTGSGVLIESRAGTGDIEGGPVEVDGRGHAIGIYAPTRMGAAYLVGNYYSQSLGGWERLPPDQELLDGIPGSDVGGGDYNNDVQLARSLGDDFLAAWQVIRDGGTPGDIRVAHFTPAGRTWSDSGAIVAASPDMDVRFQRLKSHRDGQTRLLAWTQNDGARTSLNVLRMFREGAACEAARTVDAAVGGGAARADVAVDSTGDAVAAWQQFEGGRIDDGSRSNVAFSHFDASTRTWRAAAFAETEPGNAEAPRVSANGGHALLGWVQEIGNARRVNVLRLPLAAGSAP